MKLSEFESRLPELLCQHCGAGSLTLEHNPNNNGRRPICSGCGSKTPLDGVHWLSQNSSRRPSGSRADLDAVWSENGGHCAFCGKSRALCERLRIGRTMQHLHPVALGGLHGPLIPFCARCQEASLAALKETMDIERELTTLDEIIARIQSDHPELRGGLE